MYADEVVDVAARADLLVLDEHVTKLSVATVSMLQKVELQYQLAEAQRTELRTIVDTNSAVVADNSAKVAKMTVTMEKFLGAKAEEQAQEATRKESWRKRMVLLTGVIAGTLVTFLVMRLAHL